LLLRWSAEAIKPVVTKNLNSISVAVKEEEGSMVVI
jgi:hypothetical protein